MQDINLKSRYISGENSRYTWRVKAGDDSDVCRTKSEVLEFCKAGDREVEEPESYVGFLKARVSKLGEKIADADTYERRAALIITGHSVPP